MYFENVVSNQMCEKGVNNISTCILNYTLQNGIVQLVVNYSKLIVYNTVKSMSWHK